MKIKKIEFENFRIFKDEAFEFRPLTLLVGPNSSGKSTVAKALMLLQENLRENGLGRLAFKSGAHQLGSFDSIVNYDAQEKRIGITITYANSEYKTSNKERGNIFENVAEFVVEYKFEPHPAPQIENGLLCHYSIRLVFDGVPPVTFLKVSKDATEDGAYQFYFDADWLIDQVVAKAALSTRPKIYKIWDKLSSEDFSQAFKEKKEALSKAKSSEVAELEETMDLEEGGAVQSVQEDENENENSEALLKELRCDIKKAKARREELVKEGGDEQELKSTISDIDKEIADLEKREESHINEIRKSQHNQHEELLKSNSQTRHKALDLRKKAIESRFEEKEKELKEGYVRTALYEAAKDAVKIFSLSLKNQEYDDFIPTLVGKTIADYLQEKSWAGIVNGIVESKKTARAVDIIEWSEDIDFIKKKIEELSEDILFSELLEDESEYGNQLTTDLVMRIESIVKELNKELPFVSVPAIRGFQQRLYQTAQPKSPLDKALSILLSMQYRDAKYKIQFIQKWIKAFGIGESIRAKVVEGGYVYGQVIERDGSCINIADKGLGIAQLVPIIIFTADALGENKLVCIEEPGTHLHPDLHEKLVAFLCDAYTGGGVQFLVETHSGVILTSIHYMLKEGDGGLFDKDNLGIYFLESMLDSGSTKTRLSAVGFSVGTGLDDYHLDYWTKFLGEAESKRRQIERALENDKVRLENQITKLKGNFKCLVLTEDKDTRMLRRLLVHSGFNMKETEVYSYEGSGSIDAALKLGKYAKGNRHHFTVVIHRDRDYLTDKEVSELESKIAANKGFFPFITQGTDIESYLLNVKHISESCEISIQEAEKLLLWVKHETSSISADRLLKKELKQNGKEISSHFVEIAHRMACENIRYVHGKTAFSFLNQKCDSRILKLSRHVEEPKLKEISSQISFSTLH